MTEIVIDEAAKKRSLQYIKEISAETKADISTWNLDEVFGDKLYGTPQDLNKKFFAYYRKLEYEKRRQLSDDVKKQIRNCQKKLFSPDIAKAQAERDRLLREMDLCQSKIIEIGRLVRAQQKLVDYPHDENFDFAEAVQEILDQGFWELKKVNGRVSMADRFLVEFISANDIILTEPKSDGRDFKVNFGKILVGIRTNGDVQSRPLSEQPWTLAKNGRSFFPFISNDGGICWGEGSAGAQRFIKERNYPDLFLLLKSVFTTYPGGTPYTTLVDFFMHGTDPSGKPLWINLTPEKLALYGINPPTQQELDLGITTPYECAECGHEWSIPGGPQPEYICPECDNHHELEQDYEEDDGPDEEPF